MNWIVHVSPAIENGGGVEGSFSLGDDGNTREQGLRVCVPPRARCVARAAGSWVAAGDHVIVTRDFDSERLERKNGDVPTTTDSEAVSMADARRLTREA